MSDLTQGTPTKTREPRLLTELEPAHRVFLRNLGDTVTFRQVIQFHSTAHPADFWPDVFVDHRISRRALSQSALWHVFAVVLIYAVTITWPQSDVSKARIFRNQTITYYNVSEYLPPLDSGSEPAPKAQKGQPAYAKQKVISLPRNADNTRQTIIDPSTDKVLRTAKPLPNIVAWSSPTPTVPVTGLAHSRISLPAPDMSVVAPTVANVARNLANVKVAPAPDAVAPVPDLGSRDLAKLNAPKLPSPGAVEPTVNADVTRKLGDLNIGKLLPTAEAPKLEVAEQRSSGAGGSAGTGTQQDVPASPSLGGAAGSKQAAGRLVALGLDPVTPTGPIELPGGNRRGTFAAGPEGKPGAPGTPDIVAGGKGPGGRGAGEGGPGHGGSSDMPSGVFVASNLPPGSAGVAGPANPPPAPAPASSPAHAASLPRTFPSIPTKSVTELARETRPGAQPIAGKLEERVFGPKRYYTMSLNMPNLTSGAGTWIIRFAELHDSPDKATVSAPVATLKVDPKYPADLLRENIEGTVTLYAVIRADGSVAEVKVLQGIDSRLDENAKIALSRWQFQPGTKHGDPIDVEAVVQIPFRIRRINY